MKKTITPKFPDMSVSTRLAVAAVLITSVMFQTAQAQPRIVGGTPVVDATYPWMVALVSPKQSASVGQFCGASLIAPTWVLTAAHCVEGAGASAVEVLIGRTNLLDTGGERIAVKRVIGHPDYLERSDAHDLALLELESASAVAPVDLVIPRSGYERNRRVAKTMGWGRTSFNGSASNALLQVDVPIVPHRLCHASYATIDLNIVKNNHICAGYDEGLRDSCNGDSGGPLFVEDETTGKPRLIGAVSFGEECAKPRFYGVYARISTRLDWINRQMAGTASDDETSDLIARRAKLDVACFGLRCTFDARRSGARGGALTVVDHAWDFGDGNAVSGDMIEHVYSVPGNYMVELTVTFKDGQSRSDTRVVSVDQSRRNDFKRIDRSYATEFTSSSEGEMIFPFSKPDIGMWHYSGKVTARLDVPAGSNFDLIVERYNPATTGWDEVGVSSNAPGINEGLSYKAKSGFYRYVVIRERGNGIAVIDINARRVISAK